MAEGLHACLAHHVETFDGAVASGDVAPLVALFAEDAELTFQGVPVGPFRGRDAIAAAYAAQPPTHTMTVLGATVEPDGTVVEPFSWSADRGARSGEMRLTLDGGLIRRPAVSFAR